MVNSVSSNTYSVNTQSYGVRQRGQAHDPAKLVEKIFAKVDSNSDGSIDKSEFSAAVQNRPNNGASDSASIDKLFSQIDTNGDGTISKDENSDYLKQLEEQRKAGAKNAAPPPPPDPNQLASDLLSQVDNDNDGGISVDELTNALQSSGSSNKTDDVQQLVSQLDTDKSGSISKDELAKAFEQAIASTQSSSGAQGGNGINATKEAPPPGPPPANGGGDANVSSASSSTTTYDPADANQDGKVSSAEQAAYDSKRANSPSGLAHGGKPSVAHLLERLKQAYSDSASTTNGGTLSVSA